MLVLVTKWKPAWLIQEEGELFISKCLCHTWSMLYLNILPGEFHWDGSLICFLMNSNSQLEESAFYQPLGPTWECRILDSHKDGDGEVSGNSHFKILSCVNIYIYYFCQLLLMTHLLFRNMDLSDTVWILLSWFFSPLWEPGHLVNVNERCTQWEAASGILLRDFTGRETGNLNNEVYRME